MNWRLLCSYIVPPGVSFRPGRGVMIFAAPFLLAAAIWMLAGTGVGQMVGLDEPKARIESGIKAGYWFYRAARGSEREQEKGYTFRGYVDRAQGDLLLVYLYQGSGRKRLIVRLANVREGSVNVEVFAKSYRGKNLRFDLYRLPNEKYPRAVLWERETPLNLEVIEKAGGAELNPPTNVVDKVFARYYWRLAISGS